GEQHGKTAANECSQTAAKPCGAIRLLPAHAQPYALERVSSRRSRRFVAECSARKPPSGEFVSCAFNSVSIRVLGLSERVFHSVVVKLAREFATEFFEIFLAERLFGDLFRRNRLQRR